MILSDWMTPSELITAGYNVELSYKPYIPAEELIDLQEQVIYFLFPSIMTINTVHMCLGTRQLGKYLVYLVLF